MNPNHGKDGKFISTGHATANSIFEFIAAHGGPRMTAREVKNASRKKK